MTVREALAEAERRLAAAGVETPRVDAEWLVAHVLGTTRSGLAARQDDEVDADAPSGRSVPPTPPPPSRCSSGVRPASRSRTCSASGASAG